MSWLNLPNCSIEYRKDEGRNRKFSSGNQTDGTSTYTRNLLAYVSSVGGVKVDLGKNEFPRGRSNTLDSCDSNWPETPSSNMCSSNLAAAYAARTPAIVSVNLSENKIKSLTGLCCLSSDPFPDVVPLFEDAFHKDPEESIPGNTPGDASSRNRSVSFVDADSIYSEEEYVQNEQDRKRKSSVPEFVAERLSYLQKLDMSHNYLSELALPVMKCLTGLNQLNISFNCLAEFPPIILQFSGLTTLDISNNKVGFTILYESQNNAGDLPTSSHIPPILEHLKTLDLSHNNLAKQSKEPFYVPKFILGLPTITRVNISYNDLLGLPAPNLWTSSSLLTLNASHNKIDQLNLDYISKKWDNLENFNLSNNKLKKLPREMGELSALSSLNLSHNPDLKTLPDEFGKLSRLWELNLEGLKLKLNPNIVHGRTTDLIRYLHEKLKKSVEYNRMKMMVVGYGGRGKSTLVKRLMRQIPTADPPPTVGFVIKEWKFPMKKGSRYVGQTLSCWDFAGQEEFYSQHQCFLFDKALYVVSCLQSEFGISELQTLKPWLMNIQAHAPKCPVIVVGTHIDKVPREKLSETIHRMHSSIYSLFRSPGFPSLKNAFLAEVSCGEVACGLSQLRLLIRTAVNKLNGRPVMGQMIPASYLKLQQLFAFELKTVNPSLPIINEHRVKSMVKDCKLDLEGEELRQAIRFLHETGVVLHYEDSSSHLNDLYILDPEWLCRMMAQVIAVREINPFVDQNGVLKKDVLKLLFNGKKIHHHGRRHFTFPPERINQYLKLLERFEVALPLNDHELLIPSKLPDKIPAGIQLPKDEALIRRHYNMRYIPVGFWSRLLIRLLVLSRSWLSQNGRGLGIEEVEPQQINFWKTGVIVSFVQDLTFTVHSFSKRARLECVEIAVPPSPHGAKLLGQIVDIIDSLIEEWFPGLLGVSPTGHSLVQCCAPCIQCPRLRPHVFSLNELLKQSETSDEIRCPKHDALVPLALLAPDAVFGDLERRYTLDVSELHSLVSPENLLGDGSFGCVYKGWYKGSKVAIKMYQPFGDVPVHKLIRQEATILQSLHHPSILHLIGVASRPWRLVMELAPFGSLDHVLKNREPLTRHMQHRIAYQIADGLQYLHSQKIVYRDLKPGNILVFNLAPGATINVKISDYGIAQVASPFGLSSAEGTPGYRAPEVVKGQTYLFQADVFSYGIVLYQILTSGQSPYSGQFRFELDNAVHSEVIKPISTKGFSPWTDMEELIWQCVRQNPDKRPTSSQIVEMLKDGEVLSLRRAFPLCKTNDADCIAHQMRADGGQEVWISCGEEGNSQLSWINMDETLNGFKEQRSKGTMFIDSRISTMIRVGDDHMVLGTQSGRIWVYDSDSHQRSHTLEPAEDSVVSLLHYTHRNKTDVDYLLVGLANGRVVVYPTTRSIRGKRSAMLKNITSPFCVLQSSSAQPLAVLQVGDDLQPVLCFEIGSTQRGRIYVTAGSLIQLLRVETKIQLDENIKWDTLCGGQPGNIQFMSRLNRSLHVAKRGSCVLECWSTYRRVLKNSLDLSTVLKPEDPVSPSETYAARITSMHSFDMDMLWLGCANGRIFVVDKGAYHVIRVIHRYTGPVRCIDQVRMAGCPNRILVATGWGFIPHRQKNNRATRDIEHHVSGCAFLTLWDSNIIAEEKAMQEDIQLRQEWDERQQHWEGGV
ncbi:hypothetical protein CAPTEDRAFT_224870 [Capitella teleta]|uniref:non-specific serine/threonine protein kinase n=1 Tax=Capitella teleta TaxID=283909 RepID=R7VFD9_CAPTE|nr:hypothetical protein CAPTEDRAFT_224870 [Capitella teleta]|eukprot:ELU14390.1 hypothetical protein CAPTEDRAFT_224870 [Capitella teleta]